MVRIVPCGSDATCCGSGAQRGQGLSSGRPYAICRHVRRADATVQAFFPGDEGAAAIAGVLSGRIHPSGRLPVQIPGDLAGQPGTYLVPPLASGATA
ncbi:glycoside hydrolase family 3 C-terminal domain-containing protein [Streptomyces sp. DSM 40750]|uniref:glycoside hydrolase family 3 C-terminal domain-containing protein n=1 Tax=Streptomyces sp. DSM 40750 TaxID=2801030 RepID=UPI00214CF9C1|nr:glycoside hydrolase family 3 C-terminal domain-containing protein [Streptomyces sp. DSM 40750]UUU18959.1 glycoside hydrolase family 3 C-terminal domain-containing protein [Streptomyces sp. DSM 40750]UUU27699.1 glycoside hydrolase family 3 C-terminal domain-containing protein [Streptomyces sp. DSM 40750]